jgi:hypothetical protein
MSQPTGDMKLHEPVLQCKMCQDNPRNIRLIAKENPFLMFGGK